MFEAGASAKNCMDIVALAAIKWRHLRDLARFPMPLFEYRCQDCGEQFETVVFDRRRQVTCKKCHSARVEKMISVFAVAGGSRSESAALEPGPCTSCGASQRGMCSPDD